MGWGGDAGAYAGAGGDSVGGCIDLENPTDRGRWALASLVDEDEGEAVVAFGAYGLEGGGGEVGEGGEEGGEFADALDVGVGAGGVGDGTFADDVVDEDGGAGAGEFDG